MSIIGNWSRHNLPRLVNANELAPTQRGNQLPPTLTLRLQSEPLERFRTLAAHLQPSEQMLPKPPLALTIRQIGECEYQIHLHISPELTGDPDLCRDLYGAITVFMHRAFSSLWRVESVSFSGNQNSKEGVGVFNAVLVDPSGWRLEELDAVPGAVIQIARFVQVIDGDVNRLAELLQDPELAPHLLSIGSSLIVNGAAGKLSTEVRSDRSIDPAAIEKTASRLMEMGHLDLAMMVLATGIRHERHWYDLERFIDAFLALLKDTPLLSNDRDFETAFELIDQLILSDPGMARVDHQAICKRCFSLVNHLVNLQMPKSALAFANRIYLDRPGIFRRLEDEGCPKYSLKRERPGFLRAVGGPITPAWPLDAPYQSALEQIWNAAAGSIEIMQDIVDTLGDMRQDWAKALHAQYAPTLLETKAACAVLESPQREALKAKGFEFEYVSGTDGVFIRPRGGIRSDQVNEDLITITISNVGESGFVPSVHGEGMVAYAESLLQGSPSLDHVRTFCLPVIDFLMEHFAQLPQAVQRRLLALAGAAMDLADSAMRSRTAPVRLGTVPILKNVQLFVEANILYEVLDLLPRLDRGDRAQALNLAAWAVQNRSTLFSGLPAATNQAALAQLHAPLEPLDEDLHTRPVDSQAAQAVLAPFSMGLKQRVATLFKGAAIMGTAEATKLIFECWKTLTSADDLACHTLLLRSARMSVQASTNRQMIENARKALKESLKVSNANLANALDLHRALLGFIGHNGTFGVMFGDMFGESLPEWAMTMLAEMASDPVSLQLCTVSPNAAAWPFWLHARLSLKNLSNEGRLTLLTECAKLHGVVADDQWDALFIRVIGSDLVGIHKDVDKRYPLALQAFMIWQSVSPAQVGSRERLPITFVRMLVSSLHKAIVDRRPFTGVDSQQAMTALLDQMVRWDAEAALEQLDSILASKVIQEDHPMLGVKLCVMFAAHSSKKGDAHWRGSVLAKALFHVRANPQQRSEALVLLRPFFLQPPRV